MSDGTVSDSNDLEERAGIWRLPFGLLRGVRAA